jgi:hypothetical protein
VLERKKGQILNVSLTCKIHKNISLPASLGASEFTQCLSYCSDFITATVNELGTWIDFLLLLQQIFINFLA